jgi:hypothetical protein
MPRRNDMGEPANFKLDPTVRGSRCSPHTAAQFGVRQTETQMPSASRPSLVRSVDVKKVP